MLDFNKFQAHLMELFQCHGFTHADLKVSYKKDEYSVWRINWKRDYNKSFKMDLEKVKRAIELYGKALLQGDILATNAGLMDASIGIGLLASSPFNAISHNLTKILNNKNFNWPSFRKGYTIPSDFFKKNKNGVDQVKLIDLNKIQEILMNLVKSHGVTDEELESVDKRTGRLVWGINLKSDFNQLFYKKLLALEIAFEAYEKASIQKDWWAVQALLQRIRLINFELYNFFSAIRIALENAWSDRHFSWPPFPDDYKVPAHYKYEE